jgi:hypothetical protein
MAKRILSASILCLILLGVFAVFANIQTARACENRPVVIIVNDYITLIFPPGTEGVNANATETTKYPPFQPPPQEQDVIASSETLPSDGFIGSVWDITVTGTFSGTVRVRIYYPAGSSPTEIWQTDLVLGDVNADGKVNLLDLCIISRHSAPILVTLDGIHTAT